MLDLSERFSRMDRTTANNMGRMMGLDQGTMNLLLKGRAEVETMIRRQKEYGAREVFYISGSISLPSTGESFALTRGILTNAKQIPDAQKVLQPVDYVITWESVNRSLL